ncbi:MAG: hypothetical protein ACKO7B_02080, partial [Flavobacteriales bacterium]
MPSCAYGQDTLVVVSGKAYDAKEPARRLQDLMIINLRTSQGFFGKADGTFSISIKRSDTVLVASTGYDFMYFAFGDSLEKPAYQLDVPLRRLQVQLKEVTVFSPRELNAIYKEIERLGYDKK